MTRPTLTPASRGRGLLRRYLADAVVLMGTLAVVVLTWLVGMSLLHGL